MYYEINISKNSRHLFATAPRSCTTQRDTETVAQLLRDKFPAGEGYGILVTYHPESGRDVTAEFLPCYDETASLNEQAPSKYGLRLICERYPDDREGHDIFVETLDGKYSASLACAEGEGELTGNTSGADPIKELTLRQHRWLSSEGVEAFKAKCDY